MALGLLEQKIQPVGRVSRMNNRQKFCMAIWSAAACESGSRSTSTGGLSLRRQIADDYLTQLGQGEEQVARGWKRKTIRV